jgi:hypothetical protein
MLKLLLILPCLFIMYQPLNAKVVAPNYKFEITTFNAFMPGENLAALEQKYPGAEMVSEKNGITTKKIYIKHTQYQLAVLVQAREGEILDFFARLPSYFLHDVFLQSLVNQQGKQDLYKKTGEEAYYVWEKALLKHVYSGACTITCFPIFYTVHPKDAAGKSFTPLLEQMKAP